METALRRALNALFLYGRQVAATVAEAGSSGCSEAWRAQASRRAQEVPRTALLKAATDRKQAIERYEEALASVAEVATAE